ncbi:MAG: hypothetical protein JXR32_09215 [Anaerolineaceae bacterium]|nr:hypothetical protein [Anaerolineaceae bacterium]
MTSERSQAVIFQEDALPSVFHQTPEEFIYYLERDGNKFLTFYWDQIGKKYPEEERADSYGLHYIIRKPQKKVTIVLVLMPAPQKEGEAYFEAFVYRPSRVTPILRINDMTSVFSLVMITPINDSPKTFIMERTRKGVSLEHGAGPQPVVEDFFQAVLELIRDSRGNL